jgi:2-polyprenyl-3-methyl-5-hydroxy-6-metoxy-1,4-benzoquinol methylase
VEPAATSDYEASAEAYAADVARREQGGVAGDPLGILGPLLELLGDVAGQAVLDAGCGEGYLARVLAARGARVTGLDRAPSLIARARERTPDGSIAYAVADLGEPLPAHEGRFDAVASYLVLNDVDDYRGFAATLARSLRPGGRMVLALNNPYGAVVRGHVQDYFATGTVSPYRAMWAAGMRVHHRHRTLEQYLDAFLDAGLVLAKLADLPRADHGAALPEGHRFPRFMLLEFAKGR